MTNGRTPTPTPWQERHEMNALPLTEEESLWRLDQLQREMRAGGVAPVSTTRSVRRREKINHETTLRDVEARWK